MILLDFSSAIIAMASIIVRTWLIVNPPLELAGVTIEIYRISLIVNVIIIFQDLLYVVIKAGTIVNLKLLVGFRFSIIHFKHHIVLSWVVHEYLVVNLCSF